MFTVSAPNISVIKRDTQPGVSSLIQYLLSKMKEEGKKEQQLRIKNLTESALIKN